MRGEHPPRGTSCAGQLQDHVPDLAAEGRAVVVATHDVEFVARTAHRVVVLAEGEVISAAPTAEVLAASPVFAPQVAKILATQAWLTTAEVASALRG